MQTPQVALSVIKMCIRLPFPAFDRHYLNQRIAIITSLELFSIPRNQFEN